VTDDEVEHPPRRIDVGDVELAQFDIGETQGPNLTLALADLACREIDAYEAGLRQFQRHRDEVVAAGAAQFQHATGTDVGRLQAEQPGQCGETIRMRLRKGAVDVGQFVVGGLDGVGHGLGFLAGWQRTGMVTAPGAPATPSG